VTHLPYFCSLFAVFVLLPPLIVAGQEYHPLPQLKEGAGPRDLKWHHSATTYSKDFAVHLPLIDKLFRSYHLPGAEWPAEDGIEGNPVPDGHIAQLVCPFKQADAHVNEAAVE
jgi:hypothetical protein